ncbi:MAG: relaxase/mobilization nuclease domain-containing protein [Burkholderiales bacterium]|nr:relaxase/mobilization nuclease domain-containing protein [Burkholderiales bacterium]
MILKGSQRAGGADLAAHLLNEATNERIELAEVRGTVAGDLAGAFAEYEAVACGTRCKEPLYSLSINPSAPLTREEYAAAIGHIEERLGLQGRARAVVFHDKNEREHCHVVWSRIDTDKMRAVHMGHDHQKLRALSRELAEKFGLDLPPGLANDEGVKRFDKAPNMTFAEKEQAEATGITPAMRRAEITKAYKSADNAKAFMAALEERGYYLARGDRRDFVVLDKYGHAHSLPRQIEGANTKDVRKKLAALNPAQLPSVAQARATIAARERAERERHQAKIEQASTEIRQRLKERQASRRAELDREWQAIKIRQASERLALHAAHKAANDATAFTRAAQAPTGLMAFLQRVSGIGAIRDYYARRQDLSRAQRQTQENAALQRRHGNEDLAMAGRGEALGRLERRESRSLDKNILRRARIAVRQTEQKTAQTREAIKETAQDITKRSQAKTGQKRRPRGFGIRRDG